MRQQQEDYRPSVPDATEEEAPLAFDNSVPTSDPMSTDQCQTIPEMEDSQLVGATVSMVTADVDSSRRESVHIVPAVEVSNHVRIAENSTGKRKRGRPPRTQGKLGPPQAPPASSSQRKKRDEEDVCFICFDGGSLVLCDRRGCPKAYHPACIKRDEAFFRSKAKWNCGWHICSSCQKASHYMCYTCPYSLCKGCTKDADYLCVRGNKGFCGTCMRTIMLIENMATANQEKVQVDFDDTTSWEYLFKVYWIYLKAKLSLTIDELTKAKNPWKGDDLTKVKSAWKGAGVMAPKQEPSGEFCHSNDNNGSFSDSFCGNLEIHAKRRKMEDQRKLHIEEHSLVMEKSRIDQLTQLPYSTLWATKELLDFVSHMKNGDMSALSQFDVQSLLLEYIKRNDLRDPHQKSHIFCDSRLIKLFGKEHVGHFEMLKLLEYHFLVKEKSPVDETTLMGVSNAGGGQVEAAGNSDSQLVTGSDRRRKTRKKMDDRGPQINGNPEDYAAIDVHNIRLLYLKRSLMENLMDDAGKFHEKVVGSFVRIRISGGDQKQDMYRLVQVVGIGKAAASYKVGTKTTDDMLEILNLDKKEVISIDGISNQDFSEGECKRLRQSIKCGLIKRLTVGEIQKRAMAIQDAKVRDRLEEEILRLNHLRDRASEKGHGKELRECVEKLELLKSPEERQRRLLEIPDVHADPNMNPSYDSEEDSGESHKKKQGDHARPRNSSAARNGAVLNSSMGGGDVLSDRGNMGQNLATASEQGRDTYTTSYVDRDGTNVVHVRVSESMQTQGGEQVPNSQNAPKNWVASTGSMTDDWKSQSIVQCGSYSGVVSPNLPPPLSIGREQLVDDMEMDKLWHYQDPTGKTQGPFAMADLRKWSTRGLFPRGLRVWKINEKPDDSIPLTDALFGRFHKGPALPDNSYLLAQEAIVASDKDKRHEFDMHQSTDASLVDKKNMDHWKSVQNNASVNCNDNDALLKSNALSIHSSSWTTGADAIIPNNGPAQLALQLLELSKGCKSWSDQSQICSSLSSLPTSGKIGEIPLPQAKEEHEDEKRSYDPSYVNGNSLKTPEGKNNIGKSEDKQADSESYSNQSSGQNWRPPIKSSSGWDSKPAFVSGDKSVETSQKNEEIDFFDLPSPTPKQHLKDLKGHTAENKHSISSKLPVLDSGCSWSTASSLVVGGATLARVAGEWGGYSPAPVKPVEEWDSNHVSASSLKPTDGGSDHASTQTPDSGPLTHSPSTHPVIDASDWQPIIPEPTEFCSLVDESVSDLLAEVEAMESLGGLPSPTSKLQSAEELTRGYDDDCFSPVDEFNPAPDPGKSDAFSSTADIQIPSHLTVVSEALVPCHMPSEPTVMDKQLAVSPMPSQMTAVNESLGISCTPSQSTITDEPLERSQKPSQSTLIDEPLGLSQIDVPNPQKSFSEHSSTSPEVEGNTKPNDVPVNEWEKGSEIQPLAPLAGNQGESGADIQSTTPSTASQLEAGSNAQQPTPSHEDAGQGTTKEREAQGNTNMVWGNGHGTGQQHARTNGANSAGNPGGWGSQPRYGGDRFSGPRDHRNNFQGRDRDSGFGRDRSSWNKQPLHGGGNGASTYRPPPKGQRVCKFYESGYCKKGASCSFWHP
ncbi:PREDICTED: zinc finger CCCH domain-containing protein 44 [Populus euphratica]|uniref:Zinc finger CCCH domain-containing protein 44 n=1 Tax=Populus euphratica TaxID=75702 RepID=A0AAJ6UB01_POPEU|nr:PREDICTED: zinc finger CCCH domain-containing protein 44 [Populus euphratica]